MTAPNGAEAILERAAGLMHRELGLRPDPSMLSRLRRCLRDGAASGGQEPEAYLNTLTTDAAARQRLFDSVTVQETSFFRHPGQFEALGGAVLKTLTPPVTIWSAGCANGQEAYSLAMVLDEQGSPGSVIATDVSTRALQRTTAAHYPSRELSGLSNARRSRYLRGGPDDWEIQPFIRNRVTVQHHNLVTDVLPDHLARCQVVFCRNVLIYFSPEQATTFLTRLAGQLAVGAYLFLGYAETIWQVTDLFQPVRVGDGFEYHRRREQPAPGRPEPARATVRLKPARPPSRSTTRRDPSSPAPSRRAAVRSGQSSAGSASQSLDQTRIGQEAVAARDFPAAIAAFRKCVYLAPEQPMTHVHLGLAFEASGDQAHARRAFLAARSALNRCDPSEIVAALGGYRVEELVALLDSRLAGPCP